MSLLANFDFCVILDVGENSGEAVPQFIEEIAEVNVTERF